MRQWITFIIMLALSTACLCAETVQVSSGENSISVISGSESETIIQYNINRFEKTRVDINGEEWYSIRLPKGAITLDAGSPELPILNRSIIIGDNALMKAEIFDVEYEDIPLQVVPSRGNLKRNIDPATIPYTFGDVYKTDRFYPEQIASLSEPYIMREFRGIVVRTNPFAYNPVTRTLRVYKSYKVRVFADGTDTVNVLTTARTEISREFAGIYENHFLNWDNYRYVSISDTFGRLLIIYYDSFADQIAPLYEWKRQKGIITYSTAMSTIGTTAAQVQAYIQNYYTTYSIDFVILVGDVAQIPTLTYSSGESDPSYSTVAGADDYPDIFVGRLSASVAADVTTQVNKIITYERDLNTSNTWLSRATGIASADGGSWADDGETDIQHMNNIRTDLLAYGYTTVDQIHDPGATAAQVTTALNAGRGFLNYVGHGASTYWVTTGFNVANINALTNGNMLPFIVDVACVNGDFGVATCFAEAWLRKSGGGAIGIYASSINQDWNPPMCAQDHVTDLLITESKRTMGGLFFNGSCQMIDEYGTAGVNMFRTWNIFGDPSLLVRTKTPQSMTVSYTNYMNLNTATAITVNTGLPYSHVCISIGAAMYAYGYANGSGVFTTTLTATSHRVYTLTVTAPNRVTYVNYIYAGHIWDGSSSTIWSVGANWNCGTVPSNTNEVLIPAGMPRYPVTSSATGYCNNLTIENGASVTVGDYHLYVYNDAYIYGQLNQNTTYDFSVARDLFWYTGSTASISNASADIICGRNMTFASGSNVNLAMGYLEFTGVSGATTCYLTNHSSNTQIFHLKNNVSYPNVLSFSSSSQDIVINGNFWNYSGKYTYSNYGGNIYLKGNLTDYNTTQMGVIFNSGTLILNGANQSVSLGYSGDYINNLTLAQTGTVSLVYGLALKGSLSIQSGVFNSGGQTIYVGGNWSNPVGPAAFTEGTSRVVFNGTAHQYCNYTENFNILEVNKTGGAFRVNSNSAVVTCAVYDWTAGAVDVLVGTFTANDLQDTGLYGSYYVNPGATINLTNNDSWVDLCGHLIFSGGGTINVYGGTTDSYWPYGANSSITMSGGILDFKDKSIYLYNSPTYTMDFNITGGTIKSSRGFYGTRTDFDPTGGKVELYGSIDGNVSLGAGSNFHNLHINKSAAREDEDNSNLVETDRFGNRVEHFRTNIISLNSNIDINGYFWIQTGTFNAGAYQMNVAGDWWNYVGETGFNEGTGRVVFDGAGNSAINAVENFNILEIAKTGTAYVLVNYGYSASCISYDWTSGKLYVTGGTFTAMDLADDGIYGSIELTSGTINLTQDALNYIDLRANVIISGGELHVYGGSADMVWGYGNSSSLTMSNGIINIHDRLLWIWTAAPFTSTITGGTIKVAKGFYCSRADFNPSGGFVEMYSSTDANLNMEAGSLFNLVINKTTREGETENAGEASILQRRRDGTTYTETRSNTVTAIANLDINGHFNLIAGTFIAPAQMNVRSHWYNTPGPASFIEGTGLVVFDGELNSTCDTETFYNLELNKTGSAYLRPITTASVTCTSYNWTGGKLYVNGGTFTALDMIDSYIMGTIELTAGAIHFHQTADQYLDLQANVTITGGELHLYGIMGDTYWPYAGNASLTMSNGIIDVHDTGIRINAGNTFTTSITGGTIRTARNFSCYRTDFNPTGGTVELYTSTDSYATTSSGSLYNLMINKAARVEDDESSLGTAIVALDRDGNVIHLTRSYTAYLGANLTVTNSLSIVSGSLNMNIYAATIGNDLNVYGNLIMGNAANVLTVVDDILWHNGCSANITQGSIEGGGNWWVYTNTNVQIPASVTTYLKSAQTTDSIYNADDNFQFGSLVIGSPVASAIISVYPTSTYAIWITGNLTILPGNELDVSGQSVTVNGNLYLDGKLDIHETSVTVDGKPGFATTSTLIIGSGGFTFFDSSVPRTTYLRGILNIGSGTFNAVNNSLTINSGSVNTLSSGHIICDGIIATAASNFQPVGGTVTINSNPAGGVFMTNVSNGNWLPNVILDSNTGISLAAGLIIKNNLTINSGEFSVNGNTLYCDGDIVINNSGYLTLQNPTLASNLSMRANKSLTVNNGGTFRSYGTSAQNNLVTNSTGYTTFNVESGGTIAATYTIFEKMASNGVHVKAGAIVSPSFTFSGCTFRNGASGGTLLTLNNEQDFAVFDAVFPANTWGGASNVKKTVMGGLVNFVNATGGFAGEGYDNDDYARIFWTVNPSPATPDLQIVKVQISNPVPNVGETIYVTVTYLNASTTACANNYLDMYYNQVNPPNPGQGGNNYYLIPSVPAGIPQTHTFTVNNYGDGGTWNSWLQIDTDGFVAESNESNNVFGWFNITWIATALPDISDLSIERVPGSGNIRLDWTYSSTVTYFKIYRSTDPGFSPAPANLLTTVAYPATEYIGPATVDHYFYIVTAWLDPPVRDAETQDVNVQKPSDFNEVWQRTRK